MTTDMENRRAIEQILMKNIELFAPRVCEHGPWHDCEQGCEFQDTTPMKDVMLDDFVVVTTTTRMGDGEPFVGSVAGPNTHDHIAIGMLEITKEVHLS